MAREISTIKKGGDMVYVVKAIGIILLVFGVVCLVSPSIIRNLINFAKVGKRIYIGGAIRVIFGILLLLATTSATLPAIPGIIGAIILISGILMFALGLARVHAFMDKFLNLPDNKLRIPPAVTAIIGILLIYSA